ncbi:MAG TPA: hypothetical protein VNO81_00780 [Candidatus Nitrosotenuis sp.]|jgi:hypothetical protein|nr:hypothetical protein [Candidatus Nitrosotenuis sp.]
MVWRILRGLALFALALWLANRFFGPQGALAPRAQAEGLHPVFEKDLAAKIARDQIVVVDGQESDRYIQEDLNTRDYRKALAFARLKAELLETPLHLEDQHTFGRPGSLTRVDPTDRRAWQELTLIEMDLKQAYAAAHPGDTEGYLSPAALDPQRTPQVMAEFIGRYPDSHMAATALAYIEYTTCVATARPRLALSLYRKLRAEHGDHPALAAQLDDYQERAVAYMHSWRQAGKATASR